MGATPKLSFGGAAAMGHSTPKQHRLGVAPESGSFEIVFKAGEWGAAAASQKFKEFMAAAGAPGALDAGAKQAIAIALSVMAKCDPCTRNHIRKARQMGFSQAEIDEAAWMAIAFGGSPVMMFYDGVRQDGDGYGGEGWGGMVTLLGDHAAPCGVHGHAKAKRGHATQPPKPRCVAAKAEVTGAWWRSWSSKPARRAPRFWRNPRIRKRLRRRRAGIGAALGALLGGDSQKSPRHGGPGRAPGGAAGGRDERPRGARRRRPRREAAGGPGARRGRA